MQCGLGSSVGIATELRAGRSGIESRWGRDFPSVQTGPGAHPASYKMGTGSFPVVECGRDVLLTTHPLLVPRSWKSRAIPLPTLWATPGLSRDHFTFLPFRWCYLETPLTHKAMCLLTLHPCDFHERQFADFPPLLHFGAIYYTDFRANHNETRITSLQN